MKIRKAVITAAGRDQSALPVQTLNDRDGREKSVLEILIDQCLARDVDHVAVIVSPGYEDRYAQAVGSHAGRVTFIPQPAPLGYGYAVYSARSFVGNDPFLHLVGDHLYVAPDNTGISAGLLQIAEVQSCSVSAVQPTRESLLPMYGCVGGRHMPGRRGLYRVEAVVEKPTPTEAEQKLMVSGLRSGHYLCFFGMHVLTPAIMTILGELHSAAPDKSLTLSSGLAELARREQYIAYEAPGRRFDIGSRYGLVVAQLALALSGRDRPEILARLLELLADRELSAAAAGDD